jgi:hypothetical protein
MSTTVFKGAIKAGTLSAKFMSDFSNAGSDLLIMMYAESGGGNPQSEQAAAAPGASATVSLPAGKKGVLEVWIAAGHEADSGLLQVSCDGTQADQGAILGSARWVYAVEPSQ